MKYLLGKAALGNVPSIEIRAEEYSEIEKARNTLSNALAIEEKYEIVITNYLDFEKQILDAATGYMVRQHLDYSDFFEVRLGLNIRLVNLLTAARLYVDQLNQNVRECVIDCDAREEVKRLFAKEYDENKDYRFMEAMRNYVQHRGIPVHWTEFGGRVTSMEDGSFLEYYMELASQRSFLAEDGEFKKRVLAEIGETIDLKAATRSYVESISNVHESARSLIAESVKLARELIEAAHSRYAAISDAHLVGLSAFKLEDEGHISAVPLLLEWDDIRVKLQARNKKITNLRKRYVTGRIKTPDK